MTKKVSVTSILMALLLTLSVIAMPIVVKAESEQNAAESISELRNKKAEELKEKYQKQIEEARERAKQQVEAAKEKQEAKTVEVRVKNCESRANALQNKFKSTIAAAQRHQNTFNDFNKKIDNFVSMRSLELTNGASLKMTVVEAGASSQQAVDALATFSTEPIDCNAIDDVTQNVIAYKEALDTAKDALKAYRTATKNYLVAVKASALAEETSTDTQATEGAN